VKSIHTHEQFSVALGEEAVSVLGGIAFKFLNCLRADNPDQSQFDGRNNQFNPADPDEYRNLCCAVLRCCNSLLVSVSSSLLSSYSHVLGLRQFFACNFFFDCCYRNVNSDIITK
jgi:hypothetical protein